MIAAERARQTVVGIAEQVVTADPGAVLTTYALGSCLGIVVHDPVAGVSGLVHVMLPSSAIDPERAKANPCVFVDTAVPHLFRSCYELGAVKERIVVSVVGGSFGAESEEQDSFQIGKRNVLALRKLLWKNGVIVTREDVGGQRISRTVHFHTNTGDVVVRSEGRETVL
jgi:chemotaxis protein CheD